MDKVNVSGMNTVFWDDQPNNMSINFIVASVRITAQSLFLRKNYVDQLNVIYAVLP